MKEKERKEWEKIAAKRIKECTHNQLLDAITVLTKPWNYELKIKE